MGVTARAIGDADIPALTALVNRADKADGFPFLQSESEVRRRALPSDADPALDSLLLEEDGDVVAFAVVGFSGRDGDHLRVVLSGEVDPPHRGRGFGRRLLAWQLERAQQGAQDRPEGQPAFARVYRMAGEQATDRLMRRFGLTPVRWFEDLLRPLDPPLDVPAPDGVRLVPWDEDRDDEVRDLHNDVWSDHWGSVPFTPSQWREFIDADECRPDLSLLAVTAEGELVGFCLNAHFPDDEQVTGRRDGLIDRLGTRSDWRGRGIASALIDASMQRFRAAGFTHAMLAVDRENLTGAAGLYRKLGFEPDTQSVCYQRQLE